MIKGHLKFAGALPGQNAPAVRILIEDASVSDPAPRLICERFVAVPYGIDARYEVVPFELAYDGGDTDLSVRAHLPCHDGREIRSGDLATRRSYLVAETDPLTLTLHPVR